MNNKRDEYPSIKEVNETNESLRRAREDNRREVLAYVLGYPGARRPGGWQGGSERYVPGMFRTR